MLQQKMSSDTTDSEKIKVCVRIRPMSEKEARLGAKRTALAHENNILLNTSSSSSSSSFDQTNSKIFSFDYVAGEDSTQEEIFLNAGKEIAECCMAGYHASIFAYGQTGSGKTFTIQGGTGPSGEVIDSMKGLTPRVIEYLFSLMAQAKHKSGGRIEFLCRCSYLEIYNEKIKDLLAPGSENLNIREDFRKGIYVENLTEKIVSSPEEACQVLAEGSLNRHVASTSCNQKSSRSHSVFSLMLESKEQERGGELSRVRFSRLNLIDLAGSERQKDAETSGSVLREAGCINKSLSLLGNVIRALVSVANGKVRHIPYRDSKLTFLLKDSLGGNSKTTIIATISPVDRCLGESISTLQFAGRAKLIRNKAVINEDTCGSVPKLREEVKRLKEALLKLSSANKLLVTSNSNMNNSLPTLPSTEERNVTNSTINSSDVDNNKTLNVNEINKALVEARQLQTLFLTRETLEKRVEELEQLCKKKDAYIQKCHMKEKLKEDTIARLSQDANRRYCCSRCPDPSHQPCFPKDEQEQEEGEGKNDVWNNTPPPVHVEELQFELALLKKQMQHHPGMARLAAENQRLTTELRQWEQRFGNKCQSYEAELVELRRITTTLNQQLALLQSYSTSCVIPQHPSESGNNIEENIPQNEDALSEERPTDASSSETIIETDAEDAKTKEMNNLEETYQRVYAKYEMELNAMWSFAQDLEATLEQEKQRSKSAEEQYLDEIRRWREGYELAECCTVEANRRVKMLQEKLERLSEERQRWSEAAGLKQERLKKVNRRLIEQNKQKSEEKEKKKNNIHGGRRFSLLPFYQDSTSATFEKEEEESRRHSLSSLDENNINDESNGSSWFSLAQLQQWKEFLRFARSHKDVPSASIPSTTLNEFSTSTFDASSSSSVDATMTKNATDETMDKEETIIDSPTQQNEAEEKQETEQETNTNEEMAEKEEENELAAEKKEPIEEQEKEQRMQEADAWILQLQLQLEQLQNKEKEAAEREKQEKRMLSTTQLELAQHQQTLHSLRHELSSLQQEKSELALLLQQMKEAQSKTEHQLEQQERRIEEMLEEKERTEQSRQEKEAALSAQIEKLSSQNAKLIGHQNPKQKIQLHVKIKQENNLLRKKLSEQEQKMSKMAQELKMYKALLGGSSVATIALQAQSENLLPNQPQPPQLVASSKKIVSSSSTSMPLQNLTNF